MSSLRKFLPSVTDNSVGSLLFADSSPSANWILCDGATLPQGTYSDLYSKVGLLVSSQFSGGSTWTTIGGLTSGESVLALTVNPNASVVNGAVYVFGGEKGAAGALFTSTNATTWTSRTMNTSTTINALAYGAGIYVYGQNGGRLSTSSDAITWTARTTGFGGTQHILGLAYNPNATGTQAAWIIGGSGGALATSTNAITWTARTPNTAVTISSLIYAGGIYVYGQQGGRISTSSDGATWTARTSGTASDIRALTYGNNIFVAAGVGGFLATSSDAITWTARTSGTASNILALAYNSTDTTFVYGGNAGTLATSTDATTWTALLSGTSTAINALTTNGGLYLAGALASGGNIILRTALKYNYNTSTEFILPNYSTVSIAQSNTRVTGAATFQSQLYIKAR